MVTVLPELQKMSSDYPSIPGSYRLIYSIFRLRRSDERIGLSHVECLEDKI